MTFQLQKKIRFVTKKSCFFWGGKIILNAQAKGKEETTMNEITNIVEEIVIEDFGELEATAVQHGCQCGCAGPGAGAGG